MLPFGNRVVAGVVRMRSPWRRAGPESNASCPYEMRRRDTREKPMWRPRQGWEPRVRMLRTAGSRQKPKRPGGYFLRASGGAWPCRQLDLRLVASRTWRE